LAGVVAFASGLAARSHGVWIKERVPSLAKSYIRIFG